MFYDEKNKDEEDKNNVKVKKYKNRQNWFLIVIGIGFFLFFCYMKKIVF